MSKPRALLVEDEPSSAQKTAEALQSAGFDVLCYADAASAIEHDASINEFVDLLVLDRRVPRLHGEAPYDSVGDELLTAMLQKHTDLVAIVFSGHTGFEHLQFATAERGVIAMQNNQSSKYSFDRVRLFEKGQSLEFDDYVARVHGVLSQLDDIELICEDAELSPHDKRLLRRLAFEFEGESISARRLAGGLTDAPVWLCSINGHNAPTARVVAKRQKKPGQPGGFQTVCPAQLTAGTIYVVSGFCGGFRLAVQQLVGDDPEPLLDLLGGDPDRAGVIVTALKEGLEGMPSGQQVSLQIADIASPFGEWARFRELGLDFGVVVPPGTKIATTIRSPQHGDLHPANVLVANERPIVIDFDSQTAGSELIDVVALLLGPIFHRESPLRQGSWPTKEQCHDFMGTSFLDGCTAVAYFSVVIDWLRHRQKSPRELAALILAFSMRQLQYDDVLECPQVRDRAVALATWATAQLEL